MTDNIQTLATFLTSILSKKYTNPSSDVINVLAGLDEVDRVISEFVSVLDRIIRNGSSCEYSWHMCITHTNLDVQWSCGAGQSESPLL